MLNKKIIISLIFVSQSTNVFARSPITLFIPEAKAQEIAKKNYLVPDLKTDIKPTIEQNNYIANNNNTNNNPNVLQKTQYPQSRITKSKNILPPMLNKQLILSETYQDSEPILGNNENGKVTFIYGQVQPTVICSPLRVCMIELEKNEIVQDQYAGDNIRWEINPSVSSQTPFIAIKPKEPNIKTNYVVITNKRVYSFTLQSNPSRYMAMINFSYSESYKEKWDKYYAEQKIKEAQEQKNLKPKYVLQASNLDFNYQVSGKAKFKPNKVYTDGAKTYIELPNIVNNSEIPIFYMKNENGKLQVTNSRFIDNKYIIDKKVFSGVLQAGSGKNSEKIEITYIKNINVSANNSEDYKN